MSAGYAYVLAFFSGMCIMAVELSASRLLAPFFGTSTFVWTNIIGCIMIALSAGYVLGGRLADAHPDIRVLLRLLAAAALFLVAVPFVSPFLLRGLVGLLRHANSSFSFIFFGSLAAIVLLFSAPILIMGMTGPFLVRMVASDRHVGDAAGRVFGISTIGSIVGTFLPILVFIPTLGTGKTIVLFALLLLCVTAAGFTNRTYTGGAILVAAVLAMPIPSAKSRADRIYSTESAYQYIEVLDDGQYRFLAYNDANGFQTVAKRGAVTTGFYFDYYALVPSLLAQPLERVLLVGLGGGTIANQIHHFHPTAAIDAVEIDPEVIAIARRFFSLSDTVRVHNQDGRIFVANSRSRYDVIVVDAYAEQVYIPFHLTTVEFFRDVKRSLAAGGILAMNVASSNDGSLLLRSVLNTLAVDFPHVLRFRIGNTPSTVVLASDEPFDLSRLRSADGTPLGGLARQAAAGLRKVAYDPELASLTDDKAPIEHMVDWELLGAPAGPR